MGDVFPHFWLSMVAIMGTVSLFWSINDLKTGSARLSWHSDRVTRADEPFEFWIAAGGKLLGFVVAIFMFTMGLEMLDW